MSYLASAHDPPDLSQEVRRLFDDLARRRPERRAFVSGECSPTLDVLETEHAVEIVADVPGIPGRFARAVRIQTAVDASRARATLAHGELRVAVPKLVERRGRETLVPIEAGRE